LKRLNSYSYGLSSQVILKFQKLLIIVALCLDRQSERPVADRKVKKARIRLR